MSIASIINLFKQFAMLSHTTTVQKLIDHALLQLWYADHWDNMESMPANIRLENVIGFRSQAFGIVQFLQAEVLSPDMSVDYKGIKIAKNLLPLFIERENHYEHPI